MRYLLPVLGALLILIAGCTSITSLEKPSVTPSVTSNGTTLRLTWTAVASASGYNIYYDGHSTKDTTTTATSFDISTPHTQVDVSAYNGSVESDKYTLDLKAVSTTGLIAYGTSEPTSYINAFGFNSSGTGLVLDDTIEGNKSQIAYVFEDATPPLSLYSPTEYSPPINNTYGMSIATSSDFDAYATADTGTYSTKTPITIGGVFALRMGAATTYSATDHFAKIKIDNVEGTKITFRVAYQKLAGLRWLKSS